ncbi:MAG TPA: reverse transcriptase family protein, partial [Sideroxyarcus sp.]|nr:reverse transcriptase family protein [Sideroxyarcus sp.]
MGTDPAQQLIPIPILAPDNKLYQAHADTQATVSAISPAIADRWVAAGAKEYHHHISGEMACNAKFHTNRHVSAEVITELGDNVTIEFAVFPTPSNMVVLGLPALAKLPISVKYAGRILYEGCPPVNVVAEPPTHQPGEGINFAAGSPEQQRQVTQLLLQYQANIFEWSGKFGLFKDHVEDIPLTSDRPIQVKPYRVPHGLYPVFSDLLNEYLRRRIIENASSPYSSPAFLVPKHGAKPTDPASKRYRMCCDYREINTITEDVMFPVFDVHQLLDALGSTNEFFATIDLRMGYHHIPLSAAGKKKTAFSTPMGQYQFKVLSFGMKRSPRVFQRALHMILGDLIWKCCLVYLDDIIVFGADFPTFLANLKMVIERLAAAGASISLDKSNFLATQVKFLGFIVDKDSCKPAPETLQAIKDYPRPTNNKELLRFVGMASYVRQYVHQFAHMEQALRAAIQGPSKPLRWTERTQQAFAQLKAALAN